VPQKYPCFETLFFLRQFPHAIPPHPSRHHHRPRPNSPVKLNPPTPPRISVASAPSRKTSHGPHGTRGTYLRTTRRRTHLAPRPGPQRHHSRFPRHLAFSADEAFLMSAGPGDQSRIYHTSDAGRPGNSNSPATIPNPSSTPSPSGIPLTGIVLGDPIPDEKGQLKFELLMTNDGQTWSPAPPAQLPPALEAEGPSRQQFLHRHPQP